MVNAFFIVFFSSFLRLCEIKKTLNEKEKKRSFNNIKKSSQKNEIVILSSISVYNSDQSKKIVLTFFSNLDYIFSLSVRNGVCLSVSV